MNRHSHCLKYSFEKLVLNWVSTCTQGLSGICEEKFKKIFDHVHMPQHWITRFPASTMIKKARPLCQKMWFYLPLDHLFIPCVYLIVGFKLFGSIFLALTLLGMGDNSNIEWNVITIEYHSIYKDSFIQFKNGELRRKLFDF